MEFKKRKPLPNQCADLKNKLLSVEDAWDTHNLMVTAAHRYCLGRKTYIVGACVEWILGNWHLLEIETKRRIIMETEEAIKTGLAGDLCDVDSWNRLIEETRGV